MFTGIIEAVGTIREVRNEGSNIHYLIQSLISPELKIDQSVAHEGVCLTVTDIVEGAHWVTAVQETLDRTNLKDWRPGHTVNLERSLRVGDRLDGHMVQGHVDATGSCLVREDEDGSWRFRFRFPKEFAPLIVPKGSIAINGVSLTVIDPSSSEFEVAIIPYTFEHTSFSRIRPNDAVNLEFDILGKYLQRHLELRA